MWMVIHRSRDRLKKRWMNWVKDGMIKNGVSTVMMAELEGNGTRIHVVPKPLKWQEDNVC